jgi:hypothetical protein
MLTQTFGSEDIITDPNTLQLYKMSLAEQRLRNSLTLLNEIHDSAGEYPPELVEGYNNTRNRYVQFVIPLLDELVQACDDKGASVSGSINIPPQIVVTSGLGGTQSVSYRVPELAKLPASLARFATNTSPSPAGFGDIGIGTIVICAIAFMVGVALVSAIASALTKSAKTAADIATITGITTTRAKAFEFASAAYKTCQAATPADSTKCLAEATKAAKDIANSGGIPFAPAEHTWVYYLGLFVAVAGVATVGFYAYRAKKRRKAQRDNEMPPIALLPAPSGR